MVVDDHPIASGLITHDVVTQISVSDHKEIRSLTIVSVAYFIILDLDWLCQHNPNIDWEDSLSLNCYGLTHSNLVVVMAKALVLS